MPAFVPLRICPPYHFDIKRNRQGYWIARDRGGLAGGTFLTCKDAVRFALFETGGDRGGPPLSSSQPSHGGPPLSYNTFRARVVQIHDEFLYANASAYFGEEAMWDLTSQRL